jgi:hypothetical protein
MSKFILFSSLLIFITVIFEGCGVLFPNAQYKRGVNSAIAEASDMECSITPSDKQSSNRTVLGAWDIRFDINKKAGSLLPDPELLDTLKPEKLIPDPTVKYLSYDQSSGITTLEFTLKNDSEVDLFDLRFILVTDETDVMLENRDYWTDIYNFPGGKEYDPFVAICDDNQKHCLRVNGQTSIQLQIHDPKGSSHFKLVLDGCKGENCKEPYEIGRINQHALYSQKDSSARISFYAFDWVKYSIDNAFLICPEVTGNPCISIEKNINLGYSNMIFNRTGASAGEYDAFICVRSSGLNLFKDTVIEISEGVPAFSPEVLGSENMLVSPDSIAIRDNLAYIADDMYGIKILDIKNPIAPEKLKTIDIRAQASKVKLYEDYLFISAGGDIQIYSLANDPLSPVLIGTYVFSGWLKDFAVEGNNLYIAYTDNLNIVNYSNPEKPVLAGSIDIKEISGIAVSENHAYCFARTSIKTVNIKDPANPVITGTIENNLSVSDLIVKDGILYLLDMSTLSTYDISNPESPIRLSNPPRVPQKGFQFNQHMALDGDYAYVKSEDSLVSVDVTDPGNPAVRSILKNASTSSDLAIAGNTLFMASPFDGLVIFDISDPTNLKLSPRTGHPSGHDFSVNLNEKINGKETAIMRSFNPASIAIKGNYALVAEISIFNSRDEPLISVFDISDKSKPVYLKSIGYRAYGLAIKGNYAYVAAIGRNGLLVMDVSDLPEASIISTIEMQQPTDVVIRDNYAFVSNMTPGLDVLDISDPGSPKKIGVTGLFDALHISVEGNIVCTASSRQVRIIDVNNPAFPITKSKFDLTMPQDLKQKDGFLYVSNIRGGIPVYDIRDPSNPERVNIIKTDMSTGMAIRDNYLFVADGELGLKIVDISDPLKPLISCSLEYAGNLNKIALAGDYAILTDMMGSLVTVKLNPSL